MRPYEWYTDESVAAVEDIGFAEEDRQMSLLIWKITDQPL
jgi:hypothetical protein